MRAPSRSVAVAMVPAGTIAGHVLGYVMAGEDAALHGTHSHLRPAAWVAASVVAASLGCLAMARPAQGSGHIPRISWLVSGQVALFGVLEAVEHAHSGHGALSFLSDPSFRWGVLAQLVSAAVLVAAAGLARTSGERVRAFLSRRPGGPSPCRATRCWPDLRSVAPRSSRSSAVSERGPPRLLAPA